MAKEYIVADKEEKLELILEDILIEGMSFDTSDDAQAFIDNYPADLAKHFKIVVVEVKEAE